VRTLGVLLTLVILLSSRAALAGPDYEITSNGRGRVEVRSGKRHATLFTGESSVGGDVKVSSKARTVKFERMTECNGVSNEAFTFDQLEARLLNSEALALHKKKDYAAAAKGFAEAVRLDPKWVTPAYNLACAHTQLGAIAEAVAALAPWLQSAPIATYVHVAADPELRPLLSNPALTAVHSKTPGTATVTGKGLSGYAYAPDRKLVATTTSTSAYLSCASESSVTIWDATTGQEIAAAVLVEMSDRPGDCEKNTKATTAKADQAATARAVLAGQVLTNLGFSPTLPMEPSSGEQVSEGKRVVRFKAAKLGVILESGMVSVLRGTKNIARRSVHERVHGVDYLPEAQVMVTQSYRPSDMCAETRTDVIPIKPE
jgi:hypothetical protein